MSLVISSCRKIAEATTMEKLIKMFEDLMVAVTFAEAGEFDEANKIAGNVTEQEEKSAATASARN